MGEDKVVLKPEVPNLDVGEKKYFLLSIIFFSLIAVVVSALVRRVGVDTNLLELILCAALFISAYELTAYFVQKRFDKIRVTLLPDSADLQKLTYAAAKVRWTAKGVRWFICVVFLAPIFSGALHFKLTTCLIFLYLITVSFSKSWAATKATLETGYLPPAKIK